MAEKIIGLFAQDVLEDFGKDFPEVFNHIEKEEQKRINKKLNILVIDLVKEELINPKAENC